MVSIPPRGRRPKYPFGSVTLDRPLCITVKDATERANAQRALSHYRKRHSLCRLTSRYADGVVTVYKRRKDQ